MSQHYLLHIITDQKETIAHREVQPTHLFLHQLVDATLLHNRIWEHEKHLWINDQPIIVCTPWSPDAIDVYGASIEHTLYASCAVVEHGWILHWYVWDDTTVPTGSFRILRSTQGDYSSINGVEQLLAHGFLYEDRLYDIVYAVYDVDRHVILVFCEENDL